MRRTRLILFITIVVLFTFFLFIAGYIAQQRTLAVIQKAINQETPLKVSSLSGHSRLIEYLSVSDLEFEHDSNDIDSIIDILKQIRITSLDDGISKTWRPRKGDINGPLLNGRTREKKQWAHVQFVNTPYEVCSAVMILAEMYALGSKGLRVLLYPKVWDEELGLDLGDANMQGEEARKWTGTTAGSRPKQKAAGKKENVLNGKKVQSTSGQGPALSAEENGDEKKEGPKSKWKGEKTADRWQKTARRILLSVGRRYGIQLISIEPLETLRHLSDDNIHSGSIPLPFQPPVSFEPDTYALHTSKALLKPHLYGVITPIHLLNLTQFARVSYVHPLGLPLKSMDTLITKTHLPFTPTVAYPQQYWVQPSGSHRGYTPPFMILTPNSHAADLAWKDMLSTNSVARWASRISSSSASKESIISAAGSGSFGVISAAIAAATEVLLTTEALYSSRLILPPYPWHIPTHELYKPLENDNGPRHRSFLGGLREWNITQIEEEVYYIAFTDAENIRGMRKPWFAWDEEKMGKVEEMILGKPKEGGVDEKGREERVKEVAAWRRWYRMYAERRRDVCLLDLEAVKKKERGK